MKALKTPILTALLAIVLAGLMATTTSVQAATPTAAEIEASVANALRAFRDEVDGADDYLSEAKGVLVIPDVRKVGFLVAAQWGTGALQVEGRTTDYYKMEAGSAGFQAGYQKTNQVFIFFTDDALEKFRSGDGWTVGAEAGLTLVEVGTGISADTLRNQGAVAAFAFGSEGLMGGWSAKGTRFSRIQPGR
ncbi:YSC84-related protein [Halomonas sp. CKK8]|uniref:lipid-binding SYLF domain-containing protein n=1 Tax=Halomonas sp. CKK8 TaxID=3036127 RepID=UPI00241528AE|nr:YSC84-related protein [Halomonas sp. CKK8]WFM72425.1 YSC84-related protein [Halomonas sp. CKK8]